LKLLSAIAKEIPDAAKKCGATLIDVEKLLAAITTLDSPMTFFYHVGKDIVVNGVQIFHDVEAMINDY